MKNRKFIRNSFICILIFMFQIFYVPVIHAQNLGTSSNMDVVFVLDSSGSMSTSDPEEIRTEAIKMFLDMSHVQGDKVGLVAYSDNIVREKSLDKISSSQDKDSIKSMIEGIPFGQKTDTGLGLKRAVQLMDSGHDSTHKPVIVLLSDGKNDPQRNSDASLKDLNDAIKEAHDKGYPVYTIGLNADGSVDKNQLGSISQGTDGKSFITNTAQDLPTILRDIFADNLKLKVMDAGTIQANGDYQDVKFSIPNSSVMEANISMISTNPVQVKLIDPKGTEEPVPSTNNILTSSKKYSLLKIVKPAQGDWTLKVKGVSGDKIQVSLIFNYDLQVEAQITPQSVHKGDKVNINAYLASNSQKVDDKDLYKDMSAKLTIKNLKDNSSKEVSLTNSGSAFTGSFTMPSDDKYELKVTVDGKSFSRESTPVVIGGGAVAVSKPAKTNDSGSTGLIIGIVAAMILITLAVILVLIYKKKNRQGFGRAMLQVRDENTAIADPPLYRNLDTYKGSFSLFELLGLKEQYSETEKLRFLFRDDDSVEVKNESGCIIQKSGRNIDGDSKLILHNGERIVIRLNKVPKSVTMEFYTN
ncbi:MAG: VWA domain-containing protein [Bacillota bacterium]|nr:VWA domain-containing protein [Bacillota bacterium]